MVTHDLPQVEDRLGLGDRLAHGWKVVRELLKRPFYLLYERRLETAVDEWTIPQHIGFIMDGNRRFARQIGLGSVSDGHRRGAEKLWEVLGWAYEAGVHVVTVWCFSIDNFQRDVGEVAALLGLFEEKTREMVDHDEVHTRQVRLRYIGELERLPDGLQEAIREAESATSQYTNFQLNIAMAYGGREEITEAFRRYLRDSAASGADLSDLAESFQPESIEPFLYTNGQPEPDLILRTSGEIRLSGFLLWQSAYSEYYFTDTHWPAFRKIDFLRAIRSYSDRHRRFGR